MAVVDNRGELNTVDSGGYAFKGIFFFFFSFSYSIPLDDRERVYRERPCNCLYDRCAMEKRV